MVKCFIAFGQISLEHHVHLVLLHKLCGHILQKRVTKAYRFQRKKPTSGLAC